MKRSHFPSFRRLLLPTCLSMGILHAAAAAQDAEPANLEYYAQGEVSAPLEVPTDGAGSDSLPGSDLYVTPPVGEDDAVSDTTAASPPKPAAAVNPYKGVFYNNDFSYLEDPANQEYHFGDALKRLRHDCWVLDLGGEFRLRQHNEHNLRGSNLSGLDDNFLLQRTRLFANLEYGDWFRFYGETIDAVSYWEDFAPRTIEENNWDALNLFADALLFDTGNGQYWGRVGRQELLYGEQRLVSPLDWANTRRTFDGAKVFYRGTDWDVDGFWTRPVPFGQHVNNDSNFDRPDQSQEFTGLYSTYKGKKDHTLDFYFLRLAEYDGPGTAFAPQDYDANTFGARWAGRSGNWLVEMEGGYQFGDFGAQPHSAGFYTVGLGREFACHPWKPKAWVYYDWASGDEDPLDDEHGTFNQLFPLAHKYLGYADLVARQNIQDLNFLVTASPSKKWNLLAWYHIFHLAEARDALYNAPGSPIRFDPTGDSGTDVGQELDLTAQYVIGPRSDILFGYSHFWAGDYIDNTTPAGVGTDVDFFYTQYTLRF